ncbi:RluA family pseudouridine synthase [Patescibacteria group bacterium]|nr:RluA family pseudouridine synthase [Patescibacteria group bacterium]
MILRIIYEDEDIVVVNKPPGVVVHPDAHHKSGSLIQELIEKYPELKNVGEDPVRPGIVHRLDKDTSGLLLITRNQNSFRYFKEVFQKRRIKKNYLVLVIGRVKNDKGKIDFPIGRSRKSPLRRVSGKGLRGKTREAVTEYHVLERFKDYTLVEAVPVTGRTHQIRSHFAAIGHPVVCDRIYSGKRFRQPADCPAELARQFLHAWKLEFITLSGAKLGLEADPPEDLERVLEFLRRDSVAAR